MTKDFEEAHGGSHGPISDLKKAAVTKADAEAVLRHEAFNLPGVIGAKVMGFDVLVTVETNDQLINLPRVLSGCSLYGRVGKKAIVAIEVDRHELCSVCKVARYEHDFVDPYLIDHSPACLVFKPQDRV